MTQTGQRISSHLSGSDGKLEAYSLVPRDEVAAKRRIYMETRQGYFAVDRLLFIHRADIHAPHQWTLTADGVVEGSLAAPETPSAASDLLALPPERAPQVSLVALDGEQGTPLAAEDQLLVRSVIEVAQHIEGALAGRIVRILYRIANDPPYFRHPRITVEVNALLDGLGYQRDATSGYHNSNNRARVRDILLALSRVEVRGERFVGRGERTVYTAPLISIRGASYGEVETRDLDLAHILEEGLPRTLLLELGWYDGVRRDDGSLGNNYALLPYDLAPFGPGERPEEVPLDPANYGATEDRLLDFLWTRCSLQHNHREIALTLAVALRRAGITNKNITRARTTLERALARLLTQGRIAAYSALPMRRSGRFQITLAPPQVRPTALPPGDETPTLPANPTGGAQEDREGTSPSPEDEDQGQAPTRTQAEATEAASEGSVSYLRVITHGGRALSASATWRTLSDRAASRLPEWGRIPEQQVQPLWQTAIDSTGDIQYALYLGAPDGLIPVVRRQIWTLREVARAGWRPPFEVLFGPLRRCEDQG